MIGVPDSKDLASVPNPSRRGALPLGLAAAAYVLALIQRPGEAAADTKIDLHVDPVGFLADVTSVWSSSGGLGQVQAGQYAGYLFPMGPFYALGDLLGLAPWLVHRLWLGTLLALAAWGAVRLLDALADRPRGVPHLVAGMLMLLNPYVTLFANRTSVTLLGFAALPWLLLCVHRGMREPRGWYWPAAIALLIASTGGGVNAAVTAWVLVGPVLLVAYEVFVGPPRWREAAGFVARAGLLSVIASLWWIVPVAEHARYGLNFLPFTESVGAIWATTSITESLRGMGYWISYLGTGFADPLRPYFDTSEALLFDLPVVIASLVVPALALVGYAWTRRLRYAPFLLGLALLGTLAVVAGFPEGTPLRRGLTAVYNHLEPVQFLRTSHKAAALAVLATACLAGLAAGELWRRLPSRPAVRVPVALAAVALAALSALPLVKGRAIDEQIAYGEVPAAWTDTARDIERELSPGERTLVLPGQPFPFYRWGNPQDPILPALTDRPVAVRTTVPYADLHAADLLVTTDALVQQRRVYPGQLRPLVELMGAKAVVTGTDHDPARSGAVEPAVADSQLREGALPEATAARGRERRFAPPAGEPGVGVSLPEVRRHDLPRARALVRVQPRGPELVVDGSAGGLAALAALGGLARDRAISYAGDRSAADLRSAAAAGAELVVTDTNRRRTFLASRSLRTTGATLGPADPISSDAAVLNPFAERGVAAQTVAAYEGGVSYVRAPFSPNFAQFPEHRPYAAFDGSPATHWRADRNLEQDRHWVEIGFTAPRDVPYVDVLPRSENGTSVAAVEVGGRSFPVRPGWNRLDVGVRRAGSLRVRIDAVRGPEEAGAGALAEVRVPGLRVREQDRVPRLLTGGLRGADLDRAQLSYLFARETGDDPLHDQSADAEAELRRSFDLPAERAFGLDALVLVAQGAPDPLLDAIAGVRAGGTRWVSSGRLQGAPRRRASRAFDGDAGTAWVSGVEGPRWIGWRTREPVELRGFSVAPAGPRVGAPSSVRVSWPGGRTRALPVSPAGEVDLQRPVRSRAFRVEVVDVLEPNPGPGSVPDAVGIAELSVPGLQRAPGAVPGDARVNAGCSVNVRVEGERVRLRPRGSITDFDAGRPLRASACGSEPLHLAPGQDLRLETSSRAFRTNLLRLRSRPPSGAPAPVGGGRVLNAGRPGRGRYDDVRLETSGPAWLVLGESYNRGWRAWCEDRDLGTPEPIDGYANGWRIDGRCATARFEFAANSAAGLSYWLAAAGCLGMLLLLAVGWRRRRMRPADPEPELVLPEEANAAADRPPRLPAGRAVAIGVAAGLACGLVFALRAGVVAGPLIALILWRGVGARALILAAGVLLAVAVPAVYALFLPRDKGGFNSDYAQDLLGAHWLGVAAWLLLALALLRMLPVARRAGGGAPPEPRAPAQPAPPASRPQPRESA